MGLRRETVSAPTTSSSKTSGVDSVVKVGSLGIASDMIGGTRMEDTPGR
jgi:hypothetical protein